MYLITLNLRMYQVSAQNDGKILVSPFSGMMMVSVVSGREPASDCADPACSRVLFTDIFSSKGRWLQTPNRGENVTY